MIRAFIAIELDDALHSALGDVAGRIKPFFNDAKWAIPRNIHITLKFLGSIEEDTAGKIAGILDAVAAGHSRFTMKFGGIGAFPSAKRPRVVWVGTTSGAQEAGLLQKDIDDPVSKLGIEKESRPFSPHLTLCRIRTPRPVPGWDRVEAAGAPEFPALEVRGIALMQSTLKPDGAEYKRLHYAGLR